MRVRTPFICVSVAILFATCSSSVRGDPEEPSGVSLLNDFLQQQRSNKESISEGVSRLIKQLGDDEFEKREAASTVLKIIGRVCGFAALRKAAEYSDDCEIRRRAAQIIQAINECPPENFVLQPRYISAAKTSRRLLFLLGMDRNFTILAIDKESNHIFVRANAEKLQQADEIIERYEKRLYRSDHPYILPLKNVDPTVTTRLLKAILTLKALIDDDGDFAIVPVENNIFITGTEVNVRQIKEILQWLDRRSK